MKDYSMTLFYKTIDGRVIRLSDIEQTYTISTGNRREDNEANYLRFLYGLLGKTIVKVINTADDPLLHDGLIAAISKYRDVHGCNLIEAKHAVEDYLEHLFSLKK